MLDFFKKKEATIHADIPASEGVPSMQAAQPMQLMPGAGGLTQMTERILKLEEENNRILRRMQNMGRWAFWLKVLIWALVLGLPVLFFQQMVDYAKAQIMENPALVGLPSQESFQHFMDGFKAQ